MELRNLCQFFPRHSPRDPLATAATRTRTKMHFKTRLNSPVHNGEYDPGRHEVGEGEAVVAVHWLLKDLKRLHKNGNFDGSFDGRFFCKNYQWDAGEFLGHVAGLDLDEKV